MNEESLSELFSFESKIEEDGNVKFPNKEFSSFKQKGFSGIKIVVYADSKKVAENLGYESNLFDKIKDMQSLPDAVVLGLLSSKGKLSNNDFVNRISF